MMPNATPKRKIKGNKLIPPRPSIEANRIYDRREAAVATGLSVITLIRAVERGELACYRCGRRVLHDGGQLISFLKRGEQPAKGGE